jgi:hypothetical protein
MTNEAPYSLTLLKVIEPVFDLDPHAVGYVSSGSTLPFNFPRRSTIRALRGGRAWVKAGRDWVAYRTTQPPVIVAVFYETANTPNRL